MLIVEKLVVMFQLVTIKIRTSLSPIKTAIAVKTVSGTSSAMVETRGRPYKNERSHESGRSSHWPVLGTCIRVAPQDTSVPMVTWVFARFGAVTHSLWSTRDSRSRVPELNAGNGMGHYHNILKSADVIQYSIFFLKLK